MMYLGLYSKSMIKSVFNTTLNFEKKEYSIESKEEGNDQESIQSKHCN